MAFRARLMQGLTKFFGQDYPEIIPMMTVTAGTLAFGGLLWAWTNPDSVRHPEVESKSMKPAWLKPAPMQKQLISSEKAEGTEQ